MNHLNRLSPIDHLFTGAGGYPIEFLFFFDGLIDPDKLRASLDEAVSVYTPCRSYLTNVESNTYGFKDVNKYVWNFQKSFEEIQKNDLSKMDAYVSRARSVPEEALLHVTLTHHPSGSCLGVSLSHCVVDGYSYFMFLTAWANLFKGNKIAPPELDRAVLVSPPKSAGDEFDRSKIFADTGFSFVEEVRPGDDAEVRWDVVDFKKSELDSIYSAAAQNTPIRLSLNDVLASELWKRFASQHHQSGQMLTFSCAYDYRRIYPKITASYFGNAIRGASFQLETSQLNHASTAEIAVKISRIVKSIDVAAVERSLSCLEELRQRVGLQGMERFHVADPETGFLVTNLSRLPLLGLDFGTGAPVDFRILTPARRTAVILPIPGGLRVQTAL